MPTSLRQPRLPNRSSKSCSSLFSYSFLGSDENRNCFNLNLIRRTARRRSRDRILISFVLSPCLQVSLKLRSLAEGVASFTKMLSIVLCHSQSVIICVISPGVQL